jgi:hypothetical protein
MDVHPPSRHLDPLLTPNSDHPTGPAAHPRLCPGRLDELNAVYLKFAFNTNTFAKK